MKERDLEKYRPRLAIMLAFSIRCFRACAVSNPHKNPYPEKGVKWDNFSIIIATV